MFVGVEVKVETHGTHNECAETVLFFDASITECSSMSEILPRVTEAIIINLRFSCVSLSS